MLCRAACHLGHTHSGSILSHCDLHRYSDDEDEFVDEAGPGGEVLPKSQGANLEALLFEAEVLFSQAYHRHRALDEELADTPGFTAGPPEQVGAYSYWAFAARRAHAEGVGGGQDLRPAASPNTAGAGHRPAGSCRQPEPPAPACALGLGSSVHGGLPYSHGQIRG